MVRAYFNSIIRLPSDLLEVATILLEFFGFSRASSLPSCFRKCAARKFVEFSEYQVCFSAFVICKMGIQHSIFLSFCWWTVQSLLP